MSTPNLAVNAVITALDMFLISNTKVPVRMTFDKVTYEMLWHGLEVAKATHEPIVKVTDTRMIEGCPMAFRFRGVEFVMEQPAG